MHTCTELSDILQDSSTEINFQHLNVNLTVTLQDIKHEWHTHTNMHMHAHPRLHKHHAYAQFSQIWIRETWVKCKTFAQLIVILMHLLWVCGCWNSLYGQLFQTLDSLMQFQPSCSNKPKQISNDGPRMVLMKVVQVACLCHNSPSGMSESKEPRSALLG